MSNKPGVEKPKKVIASQHETYGVSTIIALLVPLAGIIMGIVYLTKEKTLDRKLGEHLVAVGIFSSVIFSVLFFMYGQSLLTPRLTTEVTPAAYTAPAANSAPAWDIEGAYAKISNGMTREAVESAIGKSAANCNETDMGQSGKFQACTYGAALTDHGVIIVSYINGVVSQKSKSTY